MSSDSSRRKKSKKYNKYKDFGFSVDMLFPMETNKSGTKGKQLDIDTLFRDTPLNKQPVISFTSDVLIDRIKKRRLNKLNCYLKMLQYCHERIKNADELGCTDIEFVVVETYPECRDYDPYECLEFISEKLRQDYFDTIIISDVSMFITWKYIEEKITENIRDKK